jgi:hypothetical protein
LASVNNGEALSRGGQHKESVFLMNTDKTARGNFSVSEESVSAIKLTGYSMSLITRRSGWHDYSKPEKFMWNENERESRIKDLERAYPRSHSLDNSKELP